MSATSHKAQCEGYTKLTHGVLDRVVPKSREANAELDRGDAIVSGKTGEQQGERELAQDIADVVDGLAWQ